MAMSPNRSPVFKKIRDTKGTFHAKMSLIKDRNGMDPTEAEDTDSVPGGETKLLYGMAKNTKKENFLCLFPSTVLFQEPFTVVSVTWSLGNWGGGGNSEVRLLSHSLTTLCLLTDFCVCIVSQSPPHSLPWPLHGWVQWYTLHHLIHPRTPLVLIDSTIIACYLQGISSRTPGIPKSMDAQVSYIKCCSAAGAPSPWVPQLWIQRAD